MLVDHGLPSSSFMRVITSSRLPTCSQSHTRSRTTSTAPELCYAELLVRASRGADEHAVPHWLVSPLGMHPSQA